jgi:hypothetical protein
MPKVQSIKPTCNTTYIGCVEDLVQLLASLNDQVSGLEETYQVNEYHDPSNNERWLEIIPFP